MTESSFEDIPGTTLFDGRMSCIGYHLNMFCMSLARPSLTIGQQILFLCVSHSRAGCSDFVCIFFGIEAPLRDWILFRHRLVSGTRPLGSIASLCDEPSSGRPGTESRRLANPA
jgi:hypothetical protein